MEEKIALVLRKLYDSSREASKRINNVIDHYESTMDISDRSSVLNDLDQRVSDVYKSFGASVREILKSDFENTVNTLEACQLTVALERCREDLDNKVISDLLGVPPFLESIQILQEGGCI